MIEHVAALIGEIRDSLSDIANSGISADIRKSATAKDYKVTLEASEGRSAKATKRKSLLSFLRP
jgi:hypothetical protein